MGQCGHAGEKKGQEKEKEEEEEGNGDGRMTCGSLCDFGDRCAAAQQWRLCRLAEGTLWPRARLQPASGGNAGHARETSAIRLGRISCGGASQM
uniref:Uncharacterized protein n=1 Tax=Oryza rufipogon TaxID=4529 RepID=A0A0E0QDL3_ORYRU